MVKPSRPISEDQSIKNPGYLKLDLMLKGVRLDSSLYKRGIRQEYLLAPGHFGNLDLLLPQGTYVSVPYQEPFVGSSPYKLRFFKEKFYLASSAESIQVGVIAHPPFYDREVKPGVRLREVVACHGSYISLALGGHRYLQTHLKGRQSGAFRQDLVLTVDEVIGVLEQCRRESPLDVVTLSSWQTETEDGGVLQIEPYIRAIKKCFNVLLLVEVHLPKSRGLVDQTYAMGADSVCYHLGDLCTHGAGEELTQREVEKEVDLLQYGVSIFPPGTILSHITVGSRPYEGVIEDIDVLTKIKVLPILTVESLDVAHKEGLTAGHLAPMFGYVYNASKKNKITMNWFSRLAPFIAPIEGRFFSGDTPKLKLALLNFYQSRLFGGSISAGLSNLRRKLRVRVLKGG